MSTTNTISAPAKLGRPRVKKIADLVIDPVKRAMEGTKKSTQVVSIQGFAVGADPELILYHIPTNQVVSSIPVLRQDKHNPIDLGDDIKMYADNVLVEFSFPPAQSHDEFIERIRTVLQRAQDHLGSDYKLIPQASYVYDDDQLKPQHGIDPMAIGCTPSYNARHISQNEIKPFTDNIRSGSFHIHLGHKKLTDFNTRINAVLLLDIFLGCSSVLFDKDSTGIARRLRYGLASEHRYTDYGLEYRVLSPWIIRSPELIKLTLDLVDYTMSRIDEAESILKSVDFNTVEEAINKCDKKAANKILNTAKLPDALAARVAKSRGWPDMYKEWSIKM